jgi:hypothetical protein
METVSHRTNSMGIFCRVCKREEKPFPIFLNMRDILNTHSDYKKYCLPICGAMQSCRDLPIGLLYENLLPPSTLKMAAACTSKMSINFYYTTHSCIPTRQYFSGK